MLWTRCTRGAGSRIPRLDMPLREATRMARSLGCLSALRAPSSSGRDASSKGTVMDHSSNIQPLRRCTGPDAAARGSSFPDDSWWTLQQHQRLLFQDAHAPTDGAPIAVTTSSVNIAHIEGVVTALQCGRLATNLAGPTGHSIPGRRTVCVTTPVHAAFSTVLLWLGVADSSPSCLLAVRCRLSPEVVEARWREQPRFNTELSAAALKQRPGSAAGTKEGVAEAKLRCVKAWAQAALLNRRVVVSGQLRMEEVYDGDLNKVVSVPVIDIPQDNLLGGVKAIDVK